MHNKILVTYKSVTGFTEQYAKWIAEELDCAVVELKEISAKTLSKYDTVIFGGRFHAGLVDGLKKARAFFAESTAIEFVVFATGATPNTATEMIADAWKNNFTSDQLERVPHFYMQSGLRYAKMPLGDKLMMKAFTAMVQHKKNKSEYEKAMEKALVHSCDFSSKEYIKPLISYMLKGKQSK